MKVRVISGVIGAIIAIAAIVFAFTPYIDVLVFAASLMAVYELMKVFGVKNKAMYGMGLAFSAITVAYAGYSRFLPFTVPVGAIITAYVLTMLITMIVDHEHTTFEHAGLTMLASFLLPSALACFLRLRDMAVEFEGVVSRGHCRYFVWFCLSASALTDTFAYFTGVKLGKHKLCPKISPKKTVEGAIGGVVGSTVINVVSLIVCNKFIFDEPIVVPIWAMLIFSVVISVISMFGDLSASIIKRNFGVKDFGNIMPGHGGIMDRMDSISFVTPTVYAVIMLLVKAFIKI